MSDQVPSAGSTNPVIDGSNLINTGGGGGTIIGGTGITVTPGPPGTNTIALAPTGGAITEIDPNTGVTSVGGVVQLGATINNLGNANFRSIGGPAGTITFDLETAAFHDGGTIVGPSLVSVPQNAVTAVGTYVAPRAGLVALTFIAGLGTGITTPGHVFMQIQNGATVQVANYATGNALVGGTAWSGTLTALVNCALGETFTFNVFQDSVVAGQDFAITIIGAVI